MAASFTAEDSTREIVIKEKREERDHSGLVGTKATRASGGGCVQLSANGGERGDRYGSESGFFSGSSLESGGDSEGGEREREVEHYIVNVLKVAIGSMHISIQGPIYTMISQATCGFQENLNFLDPTGNLLSSMKVIINYNIVILSLNITLLLM